MPVTQMWSTLWRAHLTKPPWLTLSFKLCCDKDAYEGIKNSIQMLASHNCKTAVLLRPPLPHKHNKMFCFLVHKTMSWQTGKEMLLKHEPIWEWNHKIHRERSLKLTPSLRSAFHYKSQLQTMLLPKQLKLSLILLSNYVICINN
jgi:hypothetical protein